MIQPQILGAKQLTKLAPPCRYSAGLLSKQLHVSPRHLERLSWVHFHKSTHRWLHEQRMTDAAEMLRRGASIKEVWLGLGFKQASHFSYDFKRFHGLSSSEFIKKLAREAAGAGEVGAKAP
jgi:AraC-like DNA-binding protein